MGKKWQVKFNTEKCHVVRFGKGKRRPHLAYYIENKKLKVVEKVKDLGVTLNSTLSPEVHIAEIVKKANYQVANFRMAFSYKDADMMKEADDVFNSADPGVRSNGVESSPRKSRT